MSGSARLALAVVLAAAAARADIFSPGPLARAHANLEGLKNCTQCHVAGARLSNETCLKCHVEIAVRVERHAGFHGKLAAAELDCARCHRDHQGRDFKMVDWGPAGEKGFDHERTGFRLKGKHAQAKCAACHNDKLIADPAVRNLRAQQPQRATFLGAGVLCAQCHADEHRGQLSTDCKQCHDEAAWKPARGFDHARSAFPLQGAHARVECAKCHPRGSGAETFTRFKPIAHAACTDCHRDPHEKRLGDACTSCHNVNDWLDVTSGVAGQRAFHAKTRYPLTGAHLEVACKACHGPAPGMPARFKDLAFQRCNDCHIDAHVGQLGTQACDACHSVQGFRPPIYETAAHKGFPLQGAHAVVACSACHKQDRALAARAAPIRAFVEKRRRHDAVVLTNFHPPGEAERCETCHADVHRGQFAPRACAQCHGVESFARVRLDHSAFPLTGKHADAQCAACHAPDAQGVVRYRPLPAACASCHDDAHAGQFGGTDCARCHATTGFRPASFEHKPPQTAFELQGRHAPLKCDACHASVPVAKGVETRRYRGVPAACAGCHVDIHRGAFADGARCDGCHSPAGWRPVTYDHSKTGFPLEGRHTAASCNDCHTSGDFRAAIATSCVACHQDVHTGEFGVRCASCHDARGWETRFGPDAHRQTNFPLTGRHAAIACEECHLERRDRTFTRAARGCVECHQADYARTGGTSIDHARAGFATECQSCHFTTRFKGARFAGHDACFQLSGGPHAGIGCMECHTSPPPGTVTGACATNTADCIRCHSCAKMTREHDEVAGFQCNKPRKCYECHQFTVETGRRARRLR